MSLMQAEGQNDALSAVALGLGAMKAVDTVEELLGVIELNPPKVVKSLFSTALVCAGVWYVGSGGLRRRLLLGGAASGVAALAHAAERALRYRGDESKTTVISRMGLIRPS